MCDCQPISELFRVPGLHCSDEFALIRKSLDSLAGIADVTPDYVARAVRVDYCPHRLEAVAIVDAIESAGFKVAPTVEPRDDVSCASCDICAGHEAVRPRWRMTTSVGGVLLAIASVVWFIAGGTTPSMITLLAASTVSCGIPVVRAAWRSLRHFRLDMNVLMSMAAVGAFAISEYFEAATAMFLFSASLWLEAMSMERARGAVRSLVELSPTLAHRLPSVALPAANSEGETPVLDATQVVDVEPRELAVGDVILLRPGEMAPIDGTVIGGRSSLNQSAITGESLPVEKEPGDSVFAGSLCGEGVLWICATRTAESSTLARITRMVAQAQASRSRSERFVERFAARYTPLVIALAVGLAVVPPLLANWGWRWAAEVSAGEWFSRALVLLVIACPCALVISTPVTVVCGLYRAARRGMLVKGGEFLETAALIRAVAFDKTGTLTRGQPEVVSVEASAGISGDEVLAVAAALESHSEHPLARAIVSAAKSRGLVIDAVSDFAAMRGFGVRGRVRGESFFCGGLRMFAEEGIIDGPSAIQQSDDPQDESTLALVATKDSLWGTIRLADPPREEAARAIADLKELGIKSVSMLTGDSKAVARQIGQLVGIDRCYADLLPDEKVERVRAIRKVASPLAMVGDGVNDAPALAASDLGIALGAGASDTALETADVAIINDDLGRVGELVRLGRRCRTIMGQNITLALSIKAIVLIAAAFGAATLWMAVAADVGASMLVIANGMRLSGDLK